MHSVAYHKFEYGFGNCFFLQSINLPDTNINTNAFHVPVNKSTNTPLKRLQGVISTPDALPARRLLQLYSLTDIPCPLVYQNNLGNKRFAWPLLPALCC